jgi:type I restriction enzyme, R subunit
VIANLLQRLLGCRLADLGPGSSAQTLRYLKAHLDDSFGQRRGESLSVGVGHHEVDAGREQLTDPKFYAEMSKLLEDLIQQRRANAVAYEQFLKNAEALVRRMAERGKGNHPDELDSHPGAIVLFNNLASIPATTFQCPADESAKARIALELDRAMRELAPAGWKGDDTREKQVLNALFPIMGTDRDATRAIFEIIKQQRGYS